MTLRNLLQRKIELENKHIVKQNRLALIHRPQLLSFGEITKLTQSQYQNLLINELERRSVSSILMISKTRGLPFQLRKPACQKLRAFMSEKQSREVLAKICLNWKLYNMLQEFYSIELDQDCQKICSFLLLEAVQLLYPLQFHLFKNKLAGLRFESMAVLSQVSVITKQDWMKALPAIKNLVLHQKILLLELLPVQILEGQEQFLSELLCNAIFNQVQLAAAVSLFDKSIAHGLRPTECAGLLQKLASIQVQNKVSRLRCIQYLCKCHLQQQSRRVLKAKLMNWSYKSEEQEAISKRLALLTF